MNNLTRLLGGLCLGAIFLAATTTPKIQAQGVAIRPAANAKKETLTNASIIELAQLGLGDAIIIEKIRQSDCNFDTSLPGLKQLKAAKVSEAVIAAMLAPKANPAANPVPSPVVSATPPTSASAMTAGEIMPREPGIYFQGKNSLVEINPTTLAGTKSSFLGTALTYGIKKSKMRATVRGTAANTVIPTNRPVFYFSFDPSLASPGMAMTGFMSFGATSPGEFVLVKMERKNNSRETVLGEFNAFGMSSGTRDKDIQDFSFEKIKPGVFRVVPKSDLEAGEYCFYYAGTAGSMGLAGGKLFDFSVNISVL
jgi:hypothetical protein